MGITEEIWALGGAELASPRTGILVTKFDSDSTFLNTIDPA